MLMPNTEDSRVAAMRVQVHGFWSATDFRSLVLTIEDIYDRLGTVLLLGVLLQQEEKHNQELQRAERIGQQDWTWTALFSGTRYLREPEERWVREPLPDVLRAVRLFLLPCAIDAVRLESPGWVQVVGSWNPLKAVSDFVSKWRAENTKRMHINVANAAERERLHIEAALARERMRRSLS